MRAKLSTIDRVARGILGTGLIILYATHLAGPWTLIGIILLVTALVNYCPLYAVLRRLAAASAAGPQGEVLAVAGPQGALLAVTGPASTEPGSVLHTVAGPASTEPGGVLHASDASFESLVLDAKQPVLVDFWADWCGPCKAVAPVLDEVAREFIGKARVVKVNVDRCPRTADALGIRSIPTIALFRDGEVAEVLVGVQSKSRLTKMLSRVVA